MAEGILDTVFQHTAARRRLASFYNLSIMYLRFNTQPPEGGWIGTRERCRPPSEFQHTAARRRLGGRTLGRC